MASEIEEAKEWFQHRGDEKKNTLISLWEDQESDELEQELGEYYSGFENMMDEIIELQTQLETRDEVVNDLVSDGFDKAIARNLTWAVEDTENKRIIDLRYLRRHTTVEEFRELIESGVDLLRGEITNEEYQEVNENDKLLRLALAQITFLLRVENQNRYDSRLSRAYQELPDQANYSNERTQVFLEPIEDHYEELRQYEHYYQVNSDISNINDSVDQLQSGFSEMRKDISIIKNQLRELSHLGSSQPLSKEIPLDDEGYNLDKYDNGN